MRTIKTYFKGAPFYNAFLRWNRLRPRQMLEINKGPNGGIQAPSACRVKETSFVAYTYTCPLVPHQLAKMTGFW